MAVLSSFTLLELSIFASLLYSERHYTLILLLTTYEQNSEGDEHFVVLKISSRDGQLEEGTVI